jgi:hypothetical protein
MRLGVATIFDSSVVYKAAHPARPGSDEAATVGL